MDKPTTSLLSCILILFSIIVASFVSNNPAGIVRGDSFAISSSTLMQHVSSFMAFGDADTYEVGRRNAREYIKDTLVKGGISQDTIFWHYFEWKEVQQASSGKREGETTQSLVWMGVNILVWLNRTAIPNRKVRVFAAHYDTLYWGRNSTAGASTLAGVALLMETAISLNIYQKQQKANANFEEAPYLFVFFDHHEPGALGSKALAGKLPTHNIAYVIAVGSVGFQSSYSILHTFPYDHHQRSFYTPDWLACRILRAGTSQNIPIKIGGTTKARSLMYQAYRYHWHAVSYLDVDGPFAWQGVPTALLTDYDAIFDPSPHHLKLTDQIWTLQEKRLSAFARHLSAFILAKDYPDLSDDMNEISPNIFLDMLALVLNGCHQYIGVGPYIVGFVEIASLSFVIISVVKVYSNEQHVADKSTSESELDSEEDALKGRHSIAKDGEIWQGHKILVIHMLLMSATVIVDTVYAFEMLTLSFLALATIHFSRFYINIVTGFICSILCVNFLYKDVIIMSKFGVRTRDMREVRLVPLIVVYFIHSGLLLVYGYDYRRKKAKLKQKLV